MNLDGRKVILVKTGTGTIYIAPFRSPGIKRLVIASYRTMTEFFIRRAESKDAHLLPAIENSAGNLFRQIPDLAGLADGKDHSVEWYTRIIAQGVSWIAVDPHDSPVGFVVAEVLSGDLHIRELQVHYDYQRAGLGRRLLQHCLDKANSLDLASLTLTTFRSIPWNQPFYARLGFVTLQEGEISEYLKQIVLEESQHGLPADRRCVMRLPLKDTV